MNSLYANILIGLGTGLVSGLFTGYYSGLIITRRSRFDTLQADLQRHLNSIEYMAEVDGSISMDLGTSKQIHHIFSTLAHFGHRDAAQHVLEIDKSLTDKLNAPKLVSDVEAIIADARSIARSSSPSWKIYLPWGRA